MNRRSIIVYSAVAVLLLAGIGYFFCTLFFGDSGESVRTDRLTDGVEAIPSDAIFLFESGSFSEIENMTDKGSALGRLIGCIPSVASEWEAALSMHYSSKNTVSPLLVLSIPEKTDPALFLEDVLDECGGVIEKRYGQVAVHKAAVPDASFAVYGRFLIASPSMVIVESSLRHLENGTSVKDDPLYAGISGVTSDRGVLHVNFSNLGKLFSGAADRKYVSCASFFQSVADWGTFGLEDGDSPVTFDGRLINGRSGGRYADVLLSQRGGRPDVYSIVPHNASYVLTLPMSSADDYIKAWHEWLAADGRKKDYDYVNAVVSKQDSLGVSAGDFVGSLDIKELSVFSYASDGLEHKIMAFRTDNKKALKNYKDTVCTYLFKGYIPAYMGEVFRPSAEDAYCALGDWIIVGEQNEIQALRQEWKRGTFFSLQEYLEQTPAADELREITSMSLMVNTVRYTDSLETFFKKQYRDVVRNSSGNKNFGLAVLNTYRVGDRLGVRASVYSGDLESLPVPEDAAKASAVIEDVPVTVPQGPFPVKNFIDGSTNYLEQLKNYDLRLLGRSRNPVWTVKFDKPLCGTVRQIDYLKNDKLQMLFGAGNKVYLLDRLGRMVSDFPVVLEKDILLGPDVYDFKGTKDYIMMVLHTDNTIVQYDLSGKRGSGWNDISLGERIMSLPECLEVGGKTYWVVRTPYQTLIYDSHGTLCADFTKKRKLRKDTSVEPVSTHEVKVTVADGKEMILDLSDGSFRKR